MCCYIFILVTICLFNCCLTKLYLVKAFSMFRSALYLLVLFLHFNHNYIPFLAFLYLFLSYLTSVLLLYLLRCLLPILQLYLVKGINIYEFKFGAYGQAFENPRLRELGEMEFNNRLDSMCYVGEDNLLHCLVMRHIDNGARCDHVASELGKMRRHAKNHYPEKKWVCCFCRAQMPDLTDMERHTSTHTCKFSPKSFA